MRVRKTNSPQLLREVECARDSTGEWEHAVVIVLEWAPMLLVVRSELAIQKSFKIRS